MKAASSWAAVTTAASQPARLRRNAHTSGYLRVVTMLRYGLFLIPIHSLLLTFVGYPLAKFVLALWR